MTQAQHIADSNRRIKALRQSLQDEISALLQQLDSKGGKLESTQDALYNATRVRSQVLELAREGGPVALTVAERASEAAATEVYRKRQPKKPTEVAQGVGITTEAEALATVRQTVGGILDDLPGVWSDAADTIRQAIDRGVNTGASLADLEAEVRTRLSIAEDQSRVVVEAAIRGAVTNATVQAAERSAQAIGEPIGYLYDGPDDAKIRPFCSEVVGRVFTLAALRRLDNGQGLPVESHRGGYRCRHRLSPILLSDAREEGYTVNE